MIKRTYSNGFKIKYYPFLSEVFYLMLLRDLEKLKIDVMKGGLKNE